MEKTHTRKQCSYGDLSEVFEQLNGKELSYNNLVDVDAAIQLINEFPNELVTDDNKDYTFAIIKHTNVCGVAQRSTVKDSWDAALAGDPESAFGGVLVCNGTIDTATAEAINSIFFEVLIAPAFSGEALTILKSKKNRILLQMHRIPKLKREQYKSLLNGMLLQDMDEGNYNEWHEVGGRPAGEAEKADLAICQYCMQALKKQCYCIDKK